ncbi:MAG: MotA/TolQ/ExbB proton channel family protein [Elusimicrobia bacterium]|nr:MotA/TolQ/ExbB proton channel family protein [Elusimicrobiota bacterium]
MNFTFFAGVAIVAGGLLWGGLAGGRLASFLNWHGAAIVLGGTLASVLINCPARLLLGTARRLLGLFFPARTPSPEETVAELSRLAKIAKTQGGLLSIQDKAGAFAEGFLQRAVTVAIAHGEFSEARRILEAEIKQTRIAAMEECNVLRTMSVLAPMFGLLGTLVGMIQVLESITEPAKAGPAMAVALSSAFLGIAFANLLCVPVAGHLRLAAIRETLVSEIILEGVLDILSGKAPYLVELHLASYSRARRVELSRAVAPRAAPARG